MSNDDMGQYYRGLMGDPHAGGALGSMGYWAYEQEQRKFSNQQNSSPMSAEDEAIVWGFIAKWSFIGLVLFILFSAAIFAGRIWVQGTMAFLWFSDLFAVGPGGAGFLLGAAFVLTQLVAGYAIYRAVGRKALAVILSVFVLPFMNAGAFQLGRSLTATYPLLKDIEHKVQLWVFGDMDKALPMEWGGYLAFSDMHRIWTSDLVAQTIIGFSLILLPLIVLSMLALHFLRRRGNGAGSPNAQRGRTGGVEAVTTDIADVVWFVARAVRLAFLAVGHLILFGLTIVVLATGFDLIFIQEGNNIWLNVVIIAGFLLGIFAGWAAFIDKFHDVD